MANTVVEEATQYNALRVCGYKQLKFPIQAYAQLAVTYLRSAQQLQSSSSSTTTSTSSSALTRYSRCRDIIDALASILKAVAEQKNQGTYRQTSKREYGGALVTRIKNQARVTSRQLKRYLRMLSAHGLIKYGRFLRKKTVVRLTEKGSEYLQMYRKVHDLLLF